MNIERINIDSVTDFKSVREALAQIVDCLFESNRDIQKKLNNLNSQNIREIDFDITNVKNADLLLNKAENS